MGVRVESGLVRSSAVIGRDRELERLRAAVERARSGQSACLVLEGEGGIGKTRLLAEAATMARAAGLAVLTGRPPIAAPAPFSLIADGLRSWLRIHPVHDAMAPFDRGLGVVLP